MSITISARLTWFRLLSDNKLIAWLNPACAQNIAHFGADVSSVAG
jgi:hypothetical protein